MRERPALKVHEEDELLLAPAAVEHVLDGYLQVEDKVPHVSYVFARVLLRRLQIHQRVTLPVHPAHIRLPCAVLHLHGASPVSKHAVYAEALPPRDRALQHGARFHNVEVPGSEIAKQTLVIHWKCPELVNQGDLRTHDSMSNSFRTLHPSLYLLSSYMMSVHICEFSAHTHKCDLASLFVGVGVEHGEGARHVKFN